jgi:predicted TIM-barrel fold metal-dependent hydrolase
MIKDILVADGVIHGYNWTPENYAIPESEAFATAGAAFHQLLTRPGPERLSSEEFLHDWSVDELEEILFLESPVDFISYHNTPIYDFWKDGHSDLKKGFELRERNPNRVIVYGAVTPTEGDKALREMEWLVKEKGINGIKLYAARYQNGKTLPNHLDDPDFGLPFVERALELGVKTIAVHKAMPVGPVRPEPYGVTDLAEPAAIFPEMNFEIVHGGFAFVEDTAYMCTFPNVWLNMEASFGLLVNAPRRFAEAMGQFLQKGAADRMIFASGCSLMHPKPLIEMFLDWQVPEDICEGYAIPRITDEQKRDILGNNLLRLHAINPAKVRADIIDDEWARRRAEQGEVEMFTHFRSRIAQTANVVS